MIKRDFLFDKINHFISHILQVTESTHFDNVKEFDIHYDEQFSFYNIQI